MSISNNLKIIRSQRGMTQGSLAEKAGIELTQVSRIERGASEPKLETIKKLAIALSCTTDELIMDAQPKTAEYLKRTVNRIHMLTPVKQYVILDIINCYCKENVIPEPSLHEAMTEAEFNGVSIDNETRALESDLSIARELAEDIEREIYELRG